MPLLDPERFELLSTPRDGLLLDVVRGAFFRLNPTAASIAAALLAGEHSEARLEELAQRYRVERARLFKDAEDLAVELDREPGESRAPASGLTWHRAQTGYSLKHEGQTVLRLDPSSGRVELDESSQGAWASQVLLWTAPHLLALRGLTVLHASAIERGGWIHGFVGGSGAGKTTLAQVFAGHPGVGASSEDLLLLAPGPELEARVAAESTIRAWAEAHADQTTGFDGRDLFAEIERLDAAPIASLAFIGPRTPEETITSSELAPVDAMARFLLNSFAELGRPNIWRDVFSAGERFIRAGLIHELRAPDGLDRLEKSAPEFLRALKARR